jgi:hypothetical protein
LVYFTETLETVLVFLYLGFTEFSLIFQLALAPLLVLVPIAGLSVPVLARLFKRCALEDISPEWLENFSAAAYHPMERLLSDEDFNFLSRQPGFDESIYRRLRRDRLRIFREYFNRLILDFNRLHCVARALAAQTEADHSELLLKLIAIKARFTLSVMRVEVSYWRCCIRQHPLAVRGLITSLEEMSQQLRSLAHPPFEAHSAS